MASRGVERRIAERGPVGPIPIQLRATERRKGLLDGVVHNPIVVPAPQKRWARVALDRMLQIQ